MQAYYETLWNISMFSSLNHVFWHCFNPCGGCKGCQFGAQRQWPERSSRVATPAEVWNVILWRKEKKWRNLVKSKTIWRLGFHTCRFQLFQNLSKLRLYLFKCLRAVSIVIPANVTCFCWAPWFRGKNVRFDCLNMDRAYPSALFSMCLVISLGAVLLCSWRRSGRMLALHSSMLPFWWGCLSRANHGTTWWCLWWDSSVRDSLGIHGCSTLPNYCKSLCHMRD